jgi:hypothetical protein
MAIARSKLLDLSHPGWLHCTSRCVRRVFLCGDGFDHRRAWLEDRLCFLACCFALETAGYAVMANHLHVIIRMRPDIVSSWSAEEVSRRWLAVYPRAYNDDGTPKEPDEELVQRQAQDWSWVSLQRKRLADLGWYMKALKESIAKRANREDGCTGAFWEERFSSMPLLDQAALIACMAYVDLNPIREYAFVHASVIARRSGCVRSSRSGPSGCSHESVCLRMPVRPKMAFGSRRLRDALPMAMHPS